MSFFIQSSFVLLVTRCLIYSAMIIDGIPMTMDQAIVAAGLNSSKMYELMQDNTTVLIELDMLYDINTYMEMREEIDIMEEKDVRQGSGQRRKSVARDDYRWANARVPYDIDTSSMSSKDIALIKAAIADYERYTCLRFPQSTNERDRIRFQNGGGCLSFVGKIGGVQGISLARGCRYKSVIIHVIGHAIGFKHEQTRPDRDSKVMIHTQNIRSDQAYNLMRHTPSQQKDYGVPYDYSSIMHYSQYGFSANGKITMQAREPEYQNEMGNGEGLSFKDIRLANAMYFCSAHCNSRIQCPAGAFLGEDCQCYCDSGVRSYPIKVCGTVGPTVTTEAPTTAAPVFCVDRHSSCDSWAREGYCGEEVNREYMRTNCPLSCRFCSVTTEALTTSAPVASVDRLSNCYYLVQKGHCNKEGYREYMMTNCPVACRFFSVTTEAPSAAAPIACVDRQSSCDYWAQVGYCGGDSREYMTTNCPLSCRFCSVMTEAPTTAAPVSCVDRLSSCDYWAREGYCDGDYKEYMTTNCALACRFCSEMTTTTAVPTTTALPGSCADNFSQCSFWVHAGYCKTNTYVMDGCKKSCNLCNNTVTCMETNSNCEAWAKFGACDIPAYSDYMKTNCPISCDICNDKESPSPAPQPLKDCTNERPAKFCQRRENLGGCGWDEVVIWGCRKTCNLC